MEKITIVTDDGVMIKGNYWKGSSKAVLLLHMMPATKESWNTFAETLVQQEFSVLAIDLRGHGESTRQGEKTLEYEKFTNEEHQASIHDVEAAIKYLRKEGAVSIILAGASIGANLALQYQANHPEIKKAILMSPGTNYKGIITSPLAEELKEDQEVYFVAGTKDGRTAGTASEMTEKLAACMKGKRELKIYESTAHGTDLFREDQKLTEELAVWAKQEE